MHVQNCACKIADMQVTNNNMIEVALKPLASKNGLSVSVLCIALSCGLYHFSLHDDSPPFLYTV